MDILLKGIPKRHPELGRLRLGHKTKGGKTPMEPLPTWRATSPDQVSIEAFADLYGGEPQPWADRPGEWEVFSTSSELEVGVPADPIFAAYERWGKGGVQRRCDGERCLVSVQDPEGGYMEEVPCVCENNEWVVGDKDDVAKGACTLNFRLKVVLYRLPGIGIWMMTTGSVIAAGELPAQVELLRGFAERGIIVPAVLAIEHRKIKYAWEKFERNFKVPVLRVRESLERLAAGATVGQSSLGAGAGSPGLPPRSREIPSRTAESPPGTAALPAPAAPEPAKSANGATNGELVERASALMNTLEGASVRKFIAWRRERGIQAAPTKWSDADATAIIEFIESGVTG